MMLVMLFCLTVACAVLLILALVPDPSQQAIRQRLTAEVALPVGGAAPHRPSPVAKALRVLEPVNRSPRLDGMKQRLGGHLTAGHVALNAVEFLGLQEITALCAMAFYVTWVGPLKVNWLMFTAVGAVGFLLPHLWLKARIKTRQQAIARDLPEMVDLLSLCVEAGTDFMGAMTRVVREFRRCPLTEELGMVLQEIRMGKRRRDALRDLSRRVDIPDISAFTRTLVQADRMGTGIAEALRIQSEDSRMRRFYRGEKLAQQSPLKMLIPLIFCIMPAVAIVVGGPILLQFLRGDLLPKM